MGLSLKSTRRAISVLHGKRYGMGKTSELLSLLKTGNSDAARRLITKFKKAGK